MKCPYCDEEMVQGEIFGSRPILFGKGEKKGKVSFFSKMLLDGDIVLIDQMSWSNSYPAFTCEKCKKIVIEYS